MKPSLKGIALGIVLSTLLVMSLILAISYREQAHSLRARLEQTQSALRMEQENMARLNASYTAKLSLIKQLEDRLARLEKTLKELKKQLDWKSIEADFFKKQVDSLEKQVNSLKEQLREKTSEINKLHTRAVKGIAELNISFILYPDEDRLEIQSFNLTMELPDGDERILYDSYPVVIDRNTTLSIGVPVFEGGTIVWARANYEIHFKPQVKGEGMATIVWEAYTVIPWSRKFVIRGDTGIRFGGDILYTSVWP